MGAPAKANSVETVPLVARAAFAAFMASYLSASGATWARKGQAATRPATSAATVPAATTATSSPGISAFRRFAASS
ncbi:hypothetical protein D3C73_795010 [compost metagenome]